MLPGDGAFTVRCLTSHRTHRFHPDSEPSLRSHRHPRRSFLSQSSKLFLTSPKFTLSTRYTRFSLSPLYNNHTSLSARMGWTSRFMELAYHNWITCWDGSGVVIVRWVAVEEG